MRILVVDYAGHPFPYDLSCELGDRGHDVLHTYSSTTPSPHSDFEPSRNVTVVPVDIGRPFERYRVIRRLRDELSYGWRTIRVARSFRPDRVLTSNVPLVSLGLLWMWRLSTRTTWVLWLQDFQSGLAAIATGKQGFVAKTLRALEHFLIRRASTVVAISDGFADALIRLGVPPSKVVVVENWAPLGAMPERPRHNAWSREHGLDDTFVFLYSGTLGIKHSPELLKALCEEFADDPGVAIVAVGEGPGADWLREQPEPRPVQLPFQPFERVPDVLASGDVLVVLLHHDAGAFSVPSKTLSYLCAGRPVLAAIPSENAAATLVSDRARAGIVVAPNDVNAFRSAARLLMTSPDRRRQAGENARRYAEQAFDREKIADRFEHVLGIDTAGTVTPHR